MSSTAQTDHSRSTFTVKEYGGGTPRITVGFHGPGIPALQGGFIGLSFRPGVTFDEATGTARLLRDTFEGVSHTPFKR